MMLYDPHRMPYFPPQRPAGVTGRARIVLALLVAFFVLCIAVSLALAQEQPQQLPCGPLKEARASLLEKFHETEVGGGLVNERAAILVFASPGGKTWTVLAVSPDGTSCLLSAGTDWFQEKAGK